MTLVDTTSRDRRDPASAVGGDRCRDRRRGDLRAAGAAAGPDAGALPGRRRHRCPRRPVPGALPRACGRGDRAPARCPRGAGRGPAPRRRQPGGDRQVHPQRPAPPRGARHSTWTTSPARSGGSARPRCCCEHGAAVYVGDHVHDVEGAHAAGALSVSVLTGGWTEAELREAGTDVVARRTRGVPGLAGRARPGAAARRPRRTTCARRGSVLVAFSGGADSALLLAAAVRALGADHVAAATAYSDSLPQAERDPARAFAESLGVRVLTPRTHEMEREGYRANAGDRCYFCKAELLDVLGPLAAEHGLAARRHRDQRRRRGRRLPAGHPCRGRARRGDAAARRRAHQGAGARRVAGVGAADLGQAGRRLPVLAGGLRHRGQSRTGWRGSSVRRSAPGRPWPRPASTSATCGSATSATGPASRSTRQPSRRSRPSRPCWRPCVRPGFDDGRGRPARLPLRLDERAARRRRPLPVAASRQPG